MLKRREQLLAKRRTAEPQNGRVISKEASKDSIYGDWGIDEYQNFLKKLLRPNQVETYENAYNIQNAGILSRQA